MIFNRIAGDLDDSNAHEPRAEDGLAAAAACSDDELADAIVEYGLRECPTDLGVLLRAVPTLRERFVALDAAIEMVLRGRCRLGATIDNARESLTRDYPDLAAPIRTAAMLSSVMDTRAGPGIEPRAIGGEQSLPRLAGRFLADGQPRYAMHDQVGEGSEAEVYLAKDRAFSDPSHPAWVAVKRSRVTGLAASFGTSDESERARRVHHVNVVRVLDRFVDGDGRVCHVFEYVRGGDLTAWRAKFPGRVPIREAVALVRKVASGVQAVHAVGLVHRDIKPSNVLVTEGGIPKITDFGISRISQSGPGLPRQGSLAFVAPEQYRGEELDVTVAADVYGLGGLLYWLLTDANPNSSSVDGATEHLTSAVATAPSAAARRDEVDQDLDAICRRALEPRPANRYASADALAIDLERWLAFEPLSWRPTPMRRRARLMFRRHPRSLVAVSLSLVVGTIAVAVGLSAYVAGERKSANAALVAEKNAREADKIANDTTWARSTFQIIETLGKGSPDNPTQAWLNATTFGEMVIGPTLLGSDHPLKDWQERIPLAEALVGRAYAEGVEGELETMLLESCLCVWLIQADRAAEALPRLGALRARWEARLDIGDKWLVQLQVIELCARAMCPTQGATNSLGVRREALRRAEELAQTIPVQPLVIDKILKRASAAVNRAGP